MENNKDKILDYVTMQMSEEAEQSFEAAMAEDEDLRILVRLEQLRFRNIHQRVVKQLVVNDTNAHQKLEIVWWIKHKQLLLAAASVLLIFSAWLIIEQRASILMREEAVSCFFEIEQTALNIKETQNNSQADLSNFPKITDPDTILKESVIKKELNPRIKDDFYYVNVSKIYLDTSLYAIDVSAGGVPKSDSIPKSKQTESERALAAYSIGDSASIHQYYRRNPTDELAISLEAGVLYKYQQFDDAALVFKKLQSFDGSKKIAEWNELMCYAARYNYRKKDFDALVDRIQGKHHKNDLAELLYKIHR